MWPWSALLIRRYLGSMTKYRPGQPTGVPWENTFYWNKSRLGDPPGRAAMTARRAATVPAPLRLVLPTTYDQLDANDREGPFVACNVPMVQLESTPAGVATRPLPGSGPPTSCVWVPAQPASLPRDQRFLYIGTPIQSACAFVIYASPTGGYLLCHICPAPALRMDSVALGLALCGVPGPPGQPVLTVTGSPPTAPLAVFARGARDDLAPDQPTGPNGTRLLSYALKAVTMAHATATGWRFLVQTVAGNIWDSTVTGTGVLYPAPPPAP